MRTYIKQDQVIQATDKDGKVLWVPTDPGNTDYRQYQADQKSMSATDLTVQATAQAAYDASVLAGTQAVKAAAVARATALAATNVKLIVLGLTTTDIANLLNAARA
jgi:hypothetical protein